MEKKIIKRMRIIAEYEMCGFSGLELVEDNHSKSAGDNRIKHDIKLRELYDGAWDEYMAFLRAESPINWTLALLHAGYLELRESVAQHGDPEDVQDFVDTVWNEVKNGGMPFKYVREYLNLSIDKIRDPQTGQMLKRIEMKCAPLF